MHSSPSPDSYVATLHKRMLEVPQETCDEVFRAFFWGVRESSAAKQLLIADDEHHILEPDHPHAAYLSSAMRTALREHPITMAPDGALVRTELGKWVVEWWRATKRVYDACRGDAA